MPTRNQDALGKALEKVKTEDAEELVYDPESGAVEVIRKGEIVKDPDRVPATRMVREGWFA
jgi:hypothetical protein